MIKKTIIFTLFLLVGWGAFLKKIPFSLTQYLMQKNVASAEKFIFDTDSIDNLIVGSSLANMIPMDSLPNFYNLSFGGQSIFDGLNILRSKKKIPKNVFIEINVISRSESSNFKEIISSPILNTLKENSEIFRADRQPLAYIGSTFVLPTLNAFLRKVVYKVRDKIQSDSKATQTNQKDKADNSIFDKMLILHKEEYSKNIDTLKMNKQFELLKEHVNFLESKGVKVIFFEMPINHHLTQLNEPRYLRERVRNDYPNNDYISLPKAIYKTSDGFHLAGEEAISYTHYFKKEAIHITDNDK